MPDDTWADVVQTSAIRQFWLAPWSSLSFLVRLWQSLSSEQTDQPNTRLPFQKKVPIRDRVFYASSPPLFHRNALSSKLDARVGPLTAVHKNWILFNGNVTIRRTFNNFRLWANIPASRPSDFHDFQIPPHAQIPAGIRKHFPTRVCGRKQ